MTKPIPRVPRQSCCGGLYPIGVWADTAGNTRSLRHRRTDHGGYRLEPCLLQQQYLSDRVYRERRSYLEQQHVLETVGGNFGGVCTIDVSGNLFCSGSKSAVVPVDGGSKKVAMYAIEGPENWFEDAGSGQLSNGSAVIRLENLFGQSVNTGMDYHVFLTANGDCKGLYVSQKSAELV